MQGYGYETPGRDEGPARVHDIGNVAVSDFLVRVYGWMTFGLVVSGGVSLFTANSPELLGLILGTPLFMVLIIGELVLVAALSGWAHKMEATTAGAVFFAYSAINGLTLSCIFLIYTAESIASTFVLCAATFGAMSLYGYTTKADLSSFGSLMIMGLFGLIIASTVNLFLGSPAIYWLTTYAGIAIFVGLTAYDTQRLKEMAQGGFGDDGQAAKASIVGALILYLDFVNLFLMMLRVFGRRR